MPGGEGGERERHEQQRGQPAAHVGDEAQHRGQEAPEQRVGHSQQQQAHRDAHPEAHVDDRLHEQIAADALRGFVQGAGGGREPPVAHQPDEPVPEVRLLDQHEDHEDEDGRGHAQALQQRGELPEAAPPFADHDRERRGGGARGRSGILLELLGDLGHRALGLLDHPAAAHAPDVRDLGDEVVAVAGDAGREQRELRGDAPRHHAERGEQHRDHQAHRQGAPEAETREAGDHGVDEEGQQDREGDRDQDAPRKVERGDAHDQGGHHHERLDRTRGTRHGHQ